jgi:hypothetical protein
MLIVYPNGILPLHKRNETWIYGKCKRLGSKATLANSFHQSMGSKLLDHMYLYILNGVHWQLWKHP